MFFGRCFQGLLEGLRSSGWWFQMVWGSFGKAEVFRVSGSLGSFINEVILFEDVLGLIYCRCFVSNLFFLGKFCKRSPVGCSLFGPLRFCRSLKQVVLAAVEHTGMALCYAAPFLRDDMEACWCCFCEFVGSRSGSKTRGSCSGSKTTSNTSSSSSGSSSIVVAIIIKNKTTSSI